MANEIKYGFKEGFRCYYNEKTGKFAYEVEATAPKGYSSFEWWCQDVGTAEDSINEQNANLVPDLETLSTDMNEYAFTILKCVDCGALYIITQKDYDWYKDRKLDVPKRCDTCRALRKANNNKNSNKSEAKVKEEPKDIAYRAVCKTCGKEFYLTKPNYDWFMEKGYELPKKCFKCRKANKQDNAKG